MAIKLGVGATLSDTQVAAQQLAQRQAIADAMRKMGLTSGSPTVDAGVLKVANFADPIKQVVNAYFGGKEQSSIDTDKAALAKTQQEIQKKGLEDYFNQRQGAVIGDQPGPPEADGTPPAPQIIKPNPLGAVKSALESQDPLLTQLGVADLASLNKGGLTPSDIYAHAGTNFTPESVQQFVQTGDKSVLKPQTPMVTVNDQRVPANQSGNFGPKFTPPGPIPGVPDAYGQVDANTGGYKSLTPPKGTTVNVGPRLTNEAFKSGQDQVAKGFDQFNTGISTLQNIATAQTALQDISAKQLGPLSDYQQYVNGLGAKFGFNVPQTSSVQQLNAALGENLINVIRKFAPVSDTDAARAMKIVGSTGNIKEALSGILDQQAHSIGTQMDQYQRLVKSNSKYFDTPEEQDRYVQQWFPEFKAESGYTPGQNLPPPQAGGTGTPPKVVNWSDLP